MHYFLCIACVSAQCSQTPWTLARWAPLSMGFSREKYWSGLLFPSPGDLPDPGTESVSPASPALAEIVFTTSTTWDSLCIKRIFIYYFFGHVAQLADFSSPIKN